MTRTTTLWAMAGAIAVAAVVDAPAWRTAEAAPNSVSPFAGAYAGTGPITTTLIMQVDITNAGRVSGFASWSGFGLTGKYRLSGNVTADGAFSYRVDYNVTGHSPKGWTESAVGSSADSLLAESTSTTYGSAQLVKNADGSVTSVSGTGEAIVWNLQ